MKNRVDHIFFFAEFNAQKITILFRLLIKYIFKYVKEFKIEHEEISYKIAKTIFN